MARSVAVDAFYRQRWTQAQAALTALEGRSSALSNARGAVFLGALALAGVTVYEQVAPTWGWGGVCCLTAAYIGLVQWHQRIISAQAKERLRASLNQRALARMDGGWRGFSEKGDRFASADHSYTGDLDVFGQGSLFQLLDESGTIAGEERLAAWLSAPAPADEVARRQAGVRELAPLADLRQQCALEARLTREAKANPAPFIAWAEGPGGLGSIRWARPLAWLLPAAFAASVAGVSLDVLPRGVPWAVFFALLAVAALTRKALNAVYSALSSGEGGFVRFERIFGVVESQPFQSPYLQSLAARLGGSGLRASAAQRSFSRLFAFAELRQSAQLHALIHVLTLWDVHWFFQLDQWRQRHGPRVRAWFDALADFEATSSLAGFAHVRPDFPFPSVAEGPARFVAVALGHPLLTAPVRNDVALEGPAAAWVVTGSNMSGKTTLLRAMGVNAVLAQAGAPVCAQALSLTGLGVLTGMRVKDSLERGVSYFYAEVQRLKSVLTLATAAQGHALFLLDEVLLGTNTHERQWASREILRLLLATGAIGAVATHDLALTRLELPGCRVRNVHFEDQVTQGQMSFDYRLRDGVVQGTNALLVLRQAGVDVGDLQ